MFGTWVYNCAFVTLGRLFTSDAPFLLLNLSTQGKGTKTSLVWGQFTQRCVFRLKWTFHCAVDFYGSVYQIFCIAIFIKAEMQQKGCLYSEVHFVELGNFYGSVTYCVWSTFDPVSNRTSSVDAHKSPRRLLRIEGSTVDLFVLRDFQKLVRKTRPWLRKRN